MHESTVLAEYPDTVHVNAADVADVVTRSGRVLIVLDDDPTGTQSVADLPVLTKWEEADLRWALSQGASAVYVLTNTRSLDPESAATRNREIVTNASAAATELGVPIAFVSRGDSTLRGHYPLETDVIEETLRAETDRGFDGVIIVPAFPDAGRVTIGGVHYMRDAGSLVPIAETEFARDATFGYTSSDLADYVVEKTNARWSADQVVRLDLGLIRGERGVGGIVDTLMRLENATPVVVDVVVEDDMRLVALALAEAEARGKSFIYRVGPPFVRARIGQETRSPLTAEDVFGPEGSTGSEGSAVGGLVVVGSHVGLTSRQLAELTARDGLVATLEIDIQSVLDDARRDAHLAEIVGRAVDALAQGDVAVHTSRVLVKTTDADESLDISRRVSAAVVTVVQDVLAATRPRFVIAKGGITSSDVASAGLGIRHAIVRGPMLPGIVSLWEPVDGPAAGIPYIVFAGNVGDDSSLADVVAKLTHPGARGA